MKEDLDGALITDAETMVAEYKASMADFRFHNALQAVWEFVGAANKYIVVNEPWTLAKDLDKASRLDTVLYNLTESLRILALVLKPVMPVAAEKMAAALGFAKDDPEVSLLDNGGRWAVMASGVKLSEIPALFPRLEMKKEDAPAKKDGISPKKQAKSAAKPDGGKLLLTSKPLRIWICGLVR